MMRIHRCAAALVAAAMLGTTGVQLGAQGPDRPLAYDPSPRLAEVLPPEVAERVLAKIAEAGARGLPAQALERIALKGAARDVPPAEIERAVVAQSARLEHANDALARAPGRRPTGEEVEAAADALRNGVDASAVSELATSAPSGRSLAVPLHVMGGLVARGLPSDDALAAVLERLEARAPDAQIAELPEEVGRQTRGRPSLTGTALAGTRRPGAAGTTPAGVAATGGGRPRPAVPTSPGRRP